MFLGRIDLHVVERHAGSPRSRHGAAPDLIATTQDAFPSAQLLFAESGYAGNKLQTALQAIQGQGWRSCGVHKRSKASSSLPDVGLWSASSLGWDAAAGWEKTGKSGSLHPRHGCSSSLSEGKGDSWQRPLLQSLNFEPDSQNLSF